MLFFNVHFIQHTILTMGVECMAKREIKRSKEKDTKSQNFVVCKEKKYTQKCFWVKK